METICEVIAKHTGRTEAEVKEMMIVESLFQPQDAVAFGIVDGEDARVSLRSIISSISAIAFSMEGDNL